MGNILDKANKSSMFQKSFHQKVTRKRLSLEKADEFVSFLFGSGLLIDSPSLTSVVRMSTGENILSSKPVAVVNKNKIISEYKAYCSSKNATTLSDPMLYKIIDAVNPSYQKCLSGLNGTVVFGEEAFRFIMSAVKRIIPVNKQNAFLEKLSFYLDFMKISHVQHISIESNILNHCATFALSNIHKAELKQTCNVEHTKWCETCENLFTMLDEIECEIEIYCHSDIIEEEMFEFYRHRDDIENWVKQNLQNAVQEPSKTDSFDYIKMNKNCGLVIRDWAMKLLPQKYRENQSFFFGKSGMSMHMDCFHYYRDALCKTTYISCLTSSKQDVVDTTTVFENVVKQIKHDHPQITKLLIRSDNASCYAGNNVVELEAKLAKNSNIDVLSHNYNIPQLGKDQADRDAAIAKRSIRMWVNAGNDLLTASDMKKGILFNCRKDVKVLVIEIHKATIINPRTIPMISTYHTVICEKNGMIFYQYYKIGKGVKVSFSKI